ncbi:MULTISPECIES: ABC transporter substrate-binding protein [Streptomyces]|jgi:NitT/TauT family transport system substrate-binding protein|uniref:ABC transporter substrate-binding protein n=1 Tax=unclassified Streptomyces TaxID=2593676 RepID=UPI00088B6AB0|nr:MULTISPECIES: ABC transporter substrate-binding protein [unclassified Streptomyces]MDX2731371.1 ABC transporter substrate-binding protein [Streptomyces sp. PA03-2a]MDX3768667.1 ABC transporter substrate-binding protein [Streptomyces sp. AK08-01B]MDX3818601.1 ABC transporter substrate-binding protein [Streptomyces sp. AK08-01A]SCX85345.1 NitT/TauT family transport system substrate-binding protein [Streptomyces sp. 136MFCol5.1]SFS47583.1 NitT/TauT family transport system substrate-binding pro
MHPRRLLIGVVPLVLLATACGGNDASTTTSDSGKKLDKVTLTLNWYPYGEHAPFYYGKQQKIFEKHGIDLTIQAGQGSQKTVQATAAGQTDFGWADTPALLAAVDQGVRVKSLGVFLQTTPASVQSFDAKGIGSPADLKGKTIAGTAGDALSKTFPIFLKKNNIDESDVKVQNTDPAGKIAAVISGKTDGLLGYASDQGPTMQDKAKKPVSYLRFSENGLNFYSNGLLAGQKLLASKSELAGRMTQAVSEAWAAAEKAPGPAVAAMDGASEQLPPKNVLAEQFKTTLTLLHTSSTEGKAPGVNNEADWQQTIDVFAEAGMVAQPKAVGEYWDAKTAPKG